MMCVDDGDDWVALFIRTSFRRADDVDQAVARHQLSAGESCPAGVACSSASAEKGKPASLRRRGRQAPPVAAAGSLLNFVGGAARRRRHGATLIDDVIGDPKH